MIQILTAAQGTTLLRPGIAALHDAGYRVMIYAAANLRDIRRATPDLLIIGADAPKKLHSLLDDIRADTMLHHLPVIVVGASWDVFATLPVALLTDTIVLAAPLDERAFRDATRMFVPTLVRGRHPSHAVA